MVVILRRREVSLQLHPLHLSLLVITLIPVVLAMLYQVRTMFTSTGRKRILAILGFLIALFVVIPIIFLIFAMYQPLGSWEVLYGRIFW